MKRWLAGLSVAAMVSLGAGHVQAAALVDTGRGEAFSGLILDGRPLAPEIGWVHVWHAGQFSLAQDSNITGLDFWATVYGHTGGSTLLTAKIYRSDGALPATASLLATINQLMPTSTEAFTAQWNSFTGLDLDLAAGTYWFALEPAADVEFHAALWMEPANPLAHYAQNRHGYWEWDQQGQTGPDQWGMRVQGTVSAVPEPATWAMMIIGFGAVGSMVRTSRRRNAFSAA